MMKKIRQSFSHLFARQTMYKTPLTRNFNIVRPQEKDVISEVEQALHRTCVGRLLNFAKQSRPDTT